MSSKYYLLFALVLSYSLNPVHLVHAQDNDPPGFLSIDCGLAEGSDYKVSSTGIYYRSDANFIDTGESKSISPSLIGDTIETYLSTVRSFPQGNKNCYTIQPAFGKGYKYLIRATFKYGNYDSLNQMPTFDLNLGPDIWSKIEIQENSDVVREEIIHILSSDYIHVCLIKTGPSTPFISALELRPLTTSMYTSNSGSLQTFNHFDCSFTTDYTIRYKDDIYDRRWRPFNMTNTAELSTLSDINNRNIYLVPMDVMRTASTPNNISDPLQFYWKATNSDEQFYVYMHFAEVEILQANQSREFNIYINGILWNAEPVVPGYLSVNTIRNNPTTPETGNTKYRVSINRTERSTHPPIINAFEIYTAKIFSNTGTNETDVGAILDIKSTYGVTRNWQGDPCEPEAFMWDGLICNYNNNDSARIVSLNLSASGLTGEIITSIANLTQLQFLDLSNNNLSGEVPGFLSQLALSVLNLKGNNFTGPIPAQLLENKRKGILTLSFDGPGNGTSTELCGAKPCKNKGNKSTLVIVGAAVGSVVLLAAILFGIWIIRRKIFQVRKLGNQIHVNSGDIEKKKRQFTYSEVLNITRNFHKVLGKGGFGTVYHGYVDDTQVAVKMLSPSSTQGYKEFQTEASLLLSVHHKNLTSLVGYCNEGRNMGIIYEYMANRSLDEHLSEADQSMPTFTDEGKNYGILSWEIRLQIALDAAQGLEYLHHGCIPAIIHRDVKTSNILLNEQFRAKLADFGLSRAYLVEGGTHVSTVIAGTPGYLDPNYYSSNRLTEKSDVFSFGVVLLEMITGQPAVLTEDKTHIAQWVDSNVKDGDVKQVVDPRFRGKYDVNSVWKAIELAMTCASRISSRRPTMNMVVMELKECLAIEFGTPDADSNGMASTTEMESVFAPRAR